MPLIADQSILSALPGVGCVGTPSIAQGAAGTFFQFSPFFYSCFVHVLSIWKQRGMNNIQHEIDRI